MTVRKSVTVRWAMSARCCDDEGWAEIVLPTVIRNLERNMIEHKKNPEFLGSLHPVICLTMAFLLKLVLYSHSL